MLHIGRMSTADEIREFEERANGIGIKIVDVLREAGVDRSMWTRWKGGVTVPRLDNWRAMERALETLSANPAPSETPSPEKGRAA